MAFPVGFFNAAYAQNFFRRNPNSPVLRFLTGGANPQLNTTGSNNATDGSTPAQPTDGANGRGRGGLFAGQLGPMIRNRTGNRVARGSGGPPQRTEFTPPAGSNNALPNSGPPTTLGGYTVPGFQEGGMMAQGGVAIRPGAGMNPSIPADVPLGAAPNAPIAVEQINQEADNMLRTNPQLVQEIQSIVAVAMQTGELTGDELNMAVQLAKAALANPASYPQVRQFAIQNGLGTEQDIPVEMDRGMMFALIATGKAMQNNAQAATQGNAMQGQAPAEAKPPAGIVPEYKDGGMTGDKPHLAKLHPREYVVPEDALIYHGKKHFDKLVEQARAPADGQQAT